MAICTEAINDEKKNKVYNYIGISLYEFIPKFRYRYDDITQYLPAVIMLGLKTGGVESRSSWVEMLKRIWSSKSMV